MIGEVKSYDSKRSFGFIQEVGEHGVEKFFHISNVVNNVVLRVGDLVHFTLGLSRNRPNETQAVDVRLMKREDAAITPAPAVSDEVQS